MKPKLKFMLDYGANPLWAKDNLSRVECGCQIDNLEELGISKSTIDLANYVSELYWERLNPVYQGLPSFWSGKMHIFFQNKLKELLFKIESELKEQYQIENFEEANMYMKINVHEINAILFNLLTDPIGYFIMNGITFKSEENLIKEITNEYNKWKEKENIILNDF